MVSSGAMTGIQGLLQNPEPRENMVVRWCEVDVFLSHEKDLRCVDAG